MPELTPTTPPHVAAAADLPHVVGIFNYRPRAVVVSDDPPHGVVAGDAPRVVGIFHRAGAVVSPDDPPPTLNPLPLTLPALYEFSTVPE